jgi:hypothetical protein
MVDSGSGLMANAIAQYLTEFHLDPSRDTAPFFQAKPPRPEPQEVIVDTAALIRAAEEKGREEGKAIAQQGFDVALAAEKTRADERVVEERTKWAQEEGARMAAQFVDAFHTLETKLTDSVACILTPFLTDALRRQVVDDLRDTLLSLFTVKQITTIKITGPEDLLAMLSGRLGSYEASVEYIVNDQPDVTVAANDTLIETQLNAWISRLSEAVQAS